ncbi:hypothetical protein B0H19DRAFT_1123320 [Mycena capillaripes]|nr:hypothetical protein B0H19DRAFT_1123320 [Mycena capillaripes]
MVAGVLSCIPLMIAMWVRSTGRQSQAIHAAGRGFSSTRKVCGCEYADAVVRVKHEKGRCRTSKRRGGRDLRVGS